MTKAKRQIILPLVVVITVLISVITPITAHAEGENYEPRLTAPDSSIPYYSSKLNVYFQTGTPMPNCAAYAYGRIYEMNGEAPLINHGSAGEWYSINQNGGYYEYGLQPKLGAVACWSNHVAIVEQIHKNGDITVSESHWGGGYFDTRTYSDMYSHFGQKFYGYIYAYNEGMTKEFEKRLVNATDKRNDAYMLDCDTTHSNGSYEICDFGTQERVKEAKNFSQKILLDNVK